MTRRLTIPWPDAHPFADRAGRPIRILAASDEPDRALDEEANREALGRVDIVIGCGDLSPDWLCFLADAFRAPLVFVRGNHDRRGPWPAPPQLPPPSRGADERTLPGIPIIALPWPTVDRDAAPHNEQAAWGQVLGLGLGRLLRPPAGALVVSHVPPRGAGDTPTDHYHVGFAAYRLLLDRARPPLWLHGHTNLAAQESWLVRHGPTIVVNTTGSILVELVPPDAA